MTRSVALLVLDLDGVMTDGTILLHPSGEDVRSVSFRDLDAVSAARRHGVEIAILSGEEGPGSRRVAARFGITNAFWGVKDKGAGLQMLTSQLGIELDSTCYVGDADRDVPAILLAGVGLAPADASMSAKTSADHVLAAPGGRGAVAEAVELLTTIYAMTRRGES